MRTRIFLMISALFFQYSTAQAHWTDGFKRAITQTSSRLLRQPAPVPMKISAGQPTSLAPSSSTQPATSVVFVNPARLKVLETQNRKTVFRSFNSSTKGWVDSGNQHQELQVFLVLTEADSRDLASYEYAVSKVLNFAHFHSLGASFFPDQEGFAARISGFFDSSRLLELHRFLKENELTFKPIPLDQLRARQSDPTQINQWLSKPSGKNPLNLVAEGYKFIDVTAPIWQFSAFDLIAFLNTVDQPNSRVLSVRTNEQNVHVSLAVLDPEELDHLLDDLHWRCQVKPTPVQPNPDL